MGRIYKGDMKILMPFFQAMEEGKIIQVKNGNDWIDIDGDEEGLNIETLIGNQDCFRIKPDPKYRPFANAEECWAEMQKHQPFGWIKDWNDNRDIIGSVSSDDMVFVCEDGTFDFDNMIKNYTFADGTPFGVKEE